jgi:hypothetical protein
MRHLAEMAGVFRAGVVLVDEGGATGEEENGRKGHQGESSPAYAADLPQRRHRIQATPTQSLRRMNIKNSCNANYPSLWIRIRVLGPFWLKCAAGTGLL